MAEAALFAITTTTVPRSASATRRVQPGPALRAMGREALRMGLTPAAIHPDDGVWTKGRIRLWAPGRGDAAGPWTLAEFPLPDVVYDNVFVNLAVQGKVREIRRSCQRNGIPIFNPLMYGKDRVDRYLLEHEDTRRYLPTTEPADTPRRILDYVERFGTAYLKPVDGAGGRDVVRVRKASSRTGGAAYLAEADRGMLGRFQKSMNERDMRAWLARRLRGRRHIVQEGLKLIRLRGGQLDFRVVVQRDSQGEWQLVGIIPKVSRPGGVVTNIIAGGSRLTLKEVLENPETARRVDPAGLETAATRIAQRLAVLRPTLGIAGFDMGLDTAGRVSMIEMNPKPARSLLSTAMKQRSFTLCSQFASFLTQLDAR